MFKGLETPFIWDYQAGELRKKAMTGSSFKDARIPYRFIDVYAVILVDMLKEIENTVDTLIELNKLYLTKVNKFFNVSRFDTTNKLANLKFIYAGMEVKDLEVRQAVLESLEKAKYLIELTLIDITAYKTNKLAKRI